MKKDKIQDIMEDILLGVGMLVIVVILVIIAYTS